MATITVFFYLLPSFAYSYKIVFSYTLLSHIYINELLISGLHTHHTGREHHELDILLFHEVLDHISRVERVLTAPGGSLLLSGRSGVGRRTTVSLVAHMHQIEIFTPHVSRNYTVKHFKADLKTVSALAQCVCVLRFTPAHVHTQMHHVDVHVHVCALCVRVLCVHMGFMRFMGEGTNGSIMYIYYVYSIHTCSIHTCICIQGKTVLWVVYALMYTMGELLSCVPVSRTKQTNPCILCVL